MTSATSNLEPDRGSAAEAGAARPLDNLGRLLGHLKVGSLAAELATAYTEAQPGLETEAMRAVIEQHLRAASEALGGT